MGGMLSSLTMAVKTLGGHNTTCAATVQRVGRSPGKPVAAPTPSTWQQPPSALAARASAALPAEVDVLIIGSGITACSVAYGLLRGGGGGGTGVPRVAIFEARELCSGATGRNSGHIKVSPYQEWARLVRRIGPAAAAEVVRFRMAHLRLLLDLAEREGLARPAESRAVETVDVFCEAPAWHNAQQQLRTWLDAFPDQKDLWVVWEGDALRTVCLSACFFRVPFSSFRLLSGFWSFFWSFSFCNVVVHRLTG